MAIGIVIGRADEHQGTNALAVDRAFDNSTMSGASLSDRVLRVSQGLCPLGRILNATHGQHYVYRLIS